MLDIILLVIDYTEKTIEQRCKWVDLFEHNEEIKRKFKSCLIRKYPEELDFTKEKEILMKSYLECRENYRDKVLSRIHGDDILLYKKGCKFNLHLLAYCWSSKILNNQNHQGYNLDAFKLSYAGLMCHPFSSNGVFQELNDYFRKKNKDTCIRVVEMYWLISSHIIETL